VSTPVVVRSPDPDLSAAAIEAVKQWRYVPTKLNGAPVETETVVEVSFQLGQ
jgi:TonB family protein